MDDRIKKADNFRKVIWFVALLICWALVAFVVFAEVGQYYEVGAYLLWLVGAFVAMSVLAAIWLHLATTTSGFVVTQTFLASLLFVLFSWGIAAIFYSICHVVYTPDGRNYLQLSAVFFLPATFSALMYACPTFQIKQEILPWGGVFQLATRILITAAMAVFALWLFRQNF